MLYVDSAETILLNILLMILVARVKIMKGKASNGSSTLLFPMLVD